VNVSAEPDSAPREWGDEGELPANGDTPVTQERHKQALAHLAGAVSIIATRDQQGRVWALTASSLMSLSLSPPLVLFTLSLDADCYVAFAGATYISASVLNAGHIATSQRLASHGAAKYDGVPFADGPYGQPLIPGALAYLTCRVSARYPGGDHTILVGLVTHAWEGAPSDPAPLVYFARGYGTFAPLPRE
jgi:flavin reductase ActVB